MKAVTAVSRPPRAMMSHGSPAASMYMLLLSKYSSRCKHSNNNISIRKVESNQ